MSALAAEAGEYQVVIGLEVHVQLETKTKIFCGCSTDFEDAEPNTHTCPVCLGLPGSLPVLNEAAVKAAIKLAKAIDGTVPETTSFHRKNYYYPDLPKNFQITQYDEPICRDGTMEISVGGNRQTIRIRRAHLEEDPGSLQHIGGSIAAGKGTRIDYNRAGVPLMEIVTEPDFTSPRETRAFLAKLEEILEYLGIFNSRRDGSLRVDANISLIPTKSVNTDGTIDETALSQANRTEVKNISSHKGAEKALAYEVTRQRHAIRRGDLVEQETRHWDETRGITVAMRSKEAEEDYRYFLEADLPRLQVADWEHEIIIPELPDARRHRFITEYGLDEEAARKLTSTREVADFFEGIATEFDADLAATWVADNLLGELNYRDLTISDIDTRLDEFRRLIELVATEAITVKNAEELVLRTMLDEGLDPDTIVEEEGLEKSEAADVAVAVKSAIDDNPAAVADYHDGESGALNFLVGQVMQRTGGQADPSIVNQLLREHLDNS